MNSENFSKKGKAGRPPGYDAYEYSHAPCAEGLTRRGQQNHINTQRAYLIIGPRAEGFSWLLSPRLKTTILAELGRILEWTRSEEQSEEQFKHNAKRLLALAAIICEKRMKTAEAIALIRRSRGYNQPLWGTLRNAIVRAIRVYEQQYPGTSPQEISGCLLDLAITYKPKS